MLFVVLFLTFFSSFLLPSYEVYKVKSSAYDSSVVVKVQSGGQKVIYNPISGTFVPCVNGCQVVVQKEIARTKSVSQIQQIIASLGNLFKRASH